MNFIPPKQDHVITIKNEKDENKRRVTWQLFNSAFMF